MRRWAISGISKAMSIMTTNTKKTLIVIVGPTGSGKTDLSIEVAKHFGAPIISADSRQFFRGMAVGTAQPSLEQLAQAEHHLVASHDITEEYNCGRYEQEALGILERLFKTRDTVVAVGGSGLYIDALCNGMDDLPQIDPELRSELSRRLADNGLDDLLGELRERDPRFYETVDKQNPVRVMRALEVCLQTGRPYSELRSGKKVKRDFDIIKIGTSLPREELYSRIDRRVEMMMAEGLEDEARNLYPHKGLNSLQTVGYREMFDYFDGKCTREEAVELIKRNSRRYAKRQITWFGRDDSIEWFSPRDTTAVISYLDGKIFHQ